MVHFHIPLLLLLALGAEAQLQEPAPYQISVHLNLVVLQATVHDRKGVPAAGLQKHNFEVYEDGVRQSIRLFQHEDVPVTVGLVVDHSGSMRRKLTDVIAAARSFVQSSNPQDQMFVVNFNERVKIGLPPGISMSSDPEVLAKAVASSIATGQTALYDAIFEARKRLQAVTGDRKVLIVISDGGDNASKHTLAEVLQLADQSNTLVYTIGIFDDSDEDKNPDVLKKLAQTTGGEAYFPAEYKDVITICERIARDIRSRYTLGYVSTNVANPGTYRKVRVVAKVAGKQKLAVRTRIGYTAVTDQKPSGESKAPQ